MNLKSINRRAISFKIAILAIAVAVATMVGLGIFASNHAKAETVADPPTGTFIVTTTGDEIINCDWQEDWYDPSGEEDPQWSERSAYSYDLFSSEFVDGHTITRFDVEWKSSESVDVTLYDNVGNIKEADFYISLGLIGYNWKLNWVPVTSSITIDLDNPAESFELNYTDQEAPTTFKISGTVTTTENTAEPIEGAWVKYYKEDGSEVEGAEDYTNAAGAFLIEDVAIEDAPGCLVIEAEGFETYTIQISSDEASSGSIVFPEIQLPPAKDDDAEFTVKGGDNHDHFRCVMTMTIGGEQHTEIKDNLKEISGDDTTLPVGTKYSIDESGFLTANISLGDMGFSIVIEPHGKDGYVVDKWNTNGEDLVVGQEYEITTGDEIDNLVTYKAAAAETNSTAQTGDALPFVAIALSVIALFAGAVLLRKSFK